MSNYSEVQFLGYALSTIPGNLTKVEEDCDIGAYLGLEDPIADINARIDLFKEAIETAKDNAIEDSNVLKIFTIPEFSLRGNLGAYTNTEEVDYYEIIKGEITKIICQDDYNDWLFVIGSIIVANQPVDDKSVQVEVRSDLIEAYITIWNALHSPDTDPYLEHILKSMLDISSEDAPYSIYNYCMVLKGGSISPEHYRIEKEYKSLEDFILNSGLHIYTEEIVSYPSIDESHGEDKHDPDDPYSIFTTKDGTKIGMEICLDHRRCRLRKFSEGNEIVDLHIIVSCGMQIQKPAVIAKASGYVFNCDGEYSQTDDPDQDKSLEAGDHSHTEFRQVSKAYEGKVPGTGDAELGDRIVAAKKVTVTTQKNVDAIYPYGAGEIHVYNPVELS